MLKIPREWRANGQIELSKNKRRRFSSVCLRDVKLLADAKMLFGSIPNIHSIILCGCIIDGASFVHTTTPTMCDVVAFFQN